MHDFYILQGTYYYIFLNKTIFIIIEKLMEILYTSLQTHLDACKEGLNFSHIQMWYFFFKEKIDMTIINTFPMWNFK